MIGIYKITSPNNRVYIGQSIDIKRRWSDYRKLINVSEQPKLYNSIKKYGVENHTFEIICECNINELNDKERYYQDLYSVLKNGLNCVLTKSSDRNGYLSDETKKKISLSKLGQGKGVPKSEEFKKLVSINNQNRVWKQSSKDKISKSKKGKMLKESNPFYNKKHSLESKLKMSIALKGRKSPMKNKKHSKETKDKISLANKKKILGKNSNAKIVLDTQNGIFYSCVKELSLILGVCRISLARKIRGDRFNNTNYIYA